MCDHCQIDCYRPCTNSMLGPTVLLPCVRAAMLPKVMVTLILAKAFAPAVSLGSAFTGLSRLLLVAVTYRATKLAMPKRLAYRLVAGVQALQVLLIIG